MGILDNAKQVAKAVEEIHNLELYQRVLGLHSDIIRTRRGERPAAQRECRAEKTRGYSEPIAPFNSIGHALPCITKRPAGRWTFLHRLLGH
jgi:hypothetical protein